MAASAFFPSSQDDYQGQDDYRDQLAFTQM